MAEGEGFELEAFSRRERSGSLLPKSWSASEGPRASMAEGEGFEPPVPFRVQWFSRPLSTLNVFSNLDRVYCIQIAYWRGWWLSTAVL
jgi:hypothetical protein